MTVQPPEQGPPDPVAEALRMRASDADREKVAGILRDAFAEGRLTHSEYDERLTEAYQAATYGDLVPVMRDLPVPPGTLAVPMSHGVDLPVAGVVNGPVVRPGMVNQGDVSPVAIFGEVKRLGAWTVPAEFNATCIFGGGQLDFTEAILTSRETVLTAVCLFGGLEIVVPEGMIVRSEAIGIFGGVNVPATSTDPGAPTLVIKGAAIFGGIDVKLPKPPKKGRINR